ARPSATRSITCGASRSDRSAIRCSNLARGAIFGPTKWRSCGRTRPGRAMGADPHKPLREDVRLLGDLLGETLKAREGANFFDRVEEVRALAKAHHEGDADAFARLSQLLRELPLNSAVPIARAFSHFLTLANIGEQHHRVRRRREYARDPSRHPQPGSCGGALPRLVAGGAGTAELADLIASLRIELVLTAHPTEIARRTLLQAFNRIAALLDRR